MNKQTLWLACAAAMLAPLANADVTVYGRMHLDFERTKAGAANSPTLSKVQSDSSRIGFKGAEDLGDGLKAVWQVESGFAADDGASGSLASRETFIGLSSSSWGTVKAGNFLVAIDDLHGIAGNTFQYTTGISNDAALWLNGGNLATGGFDVRAGNSLSYQTPTVNGFSSRLQYSLTTGAGGKEASKDGASLISANVQYENKGLRVGYGFQQNRDMQLTSANFYQRGSTHMLAAGYNFGSLYLGGLVERDKLDNINQSGNDRTRNYGSVLASYTAGRNVFSGFYGKAGAWRGAAGVSNSGARLGTVAYNYVLSKTTQAYALYTSLRNDNNAGYVLGGSPVTGSAMRNQHSFAVGMWKNF